MSKLTFNIYVFNTLFIVVSTMLVFLPSVYDAHLTDSTQTTKSLLFFLAMLICLLIVSLLLIDKQIIFRLSVLDISLLVLILYLVVNRFLLQSDSSFSLRFWELIGLCVLYIVIRVVPAELYPLFVLSIIAGGIIQLFQGVLQLLGILTSNNANFLITGNFFNPGGYAGYLSLIGVLSFWFYINRKAIAWSRISSNARVIGLLEKSCATVSLFCFIGCCVLLPALRSRSALISVFIGLSIIWLSHNRQSMIFYWNKYRTYLYFFILVLIAMLFWLYNVKKGSADGRLLIYKVSAGMLFINPVFGVGFDNFKAHYMNAQANWFKKAGRFESPESQLADNTMYAFNEPLQFAVENGLMGVFLMTLAIVANYAFGITDKKDIFITLSVALAVAIISFGMLTYLSDNLSMKLIGTFALAIFATYKSEKFFFDAPQRVFKGLSLRVLIVTIMMSVSVFGTVNTMKCRQFLLKWKQAQDLYQQELYGQSSEIFNTMDPMFTSGELLMQYGKSLYMSEVYSASLDVLYQSQNYFNSTIIETSIGDCERKLGNYEKAEEAYVTAMYMTPSKFYPLYLLMTLYNEQGKKVHATVIAREILKKEIKIPSKAVSEIRELAKVTLNSNE